MAISKYFKFFLYIILAINSAAILYFSFFEEQNIFYFFIKVFNLFNGNFFSNE